MRIGFAIFLIVHGMIHVLGFAKAFNVATLPQLTQPISPLIGLVWLTAAVLFCLTSGALLVWPRWWPAMGAAAIVASMAAIAPSWTDARFGAAANLVVLVGLLFAVLGDGPLSEWAAYQRDVEQHLGGFVAADVLTDGDLAHLPEIVRRYLRRSGVVGQPRVRNVRVRMHGRFRQGAASRWMRFTAEQHNFYDARARLFFMKASMFLVPVQAFHRYVAGSAAMRVKAASLLPLIDLSGPDMTRAETVTLFNDMCILAPATLVDQAIAWKEIDANRVRATFSNAGYSVRAELSFNDVGELTSFWSDDRLKASPDGKTMTAVRWSTPLYDYRAFGAVRLASRGEARWHEREGDYAYIELELDDVQYNVQRR